MKARRLPPTRWITHTHTHQSPVVCSNNGSIKELNELSGINNTTNRFVLSCCWMQKRPSDVFAPKVCQGSFSVQENTFWRAMGFRPRRRRCGRRCSCLKQTSSKAVEQYTWLKIAKNFSAATKVDELLRTESASFHDSASTTGFV